jgi:hypothetical protein
MSEIIELYKEYKNDFKLLDDKQCVFEILQNYLNKFQKSKNEQLEKSQQEYKNIQNITPKTNIILFNNIIDDFDKYIDSDEYIQQINICFDILKKIGSKLDPNILKSDKYSFTYSFFKNNVKLHPHINTLLKAMYTLGCNKNIFSLEFKKFFSCGHRPTCLITDNIINITYNVDTYDEFFKKCINIEENCKKYSIMYLYEEFKNSFIILKKIIIKNIIIKLIESSQDKISSKEINLCLQECDYDLFEYLKNELTIFNSHVYTPQNNISYKIDDYTDFCKTLDINKIINNDYVIKFGFVTFSTFGSKNQKLKTTNVFNSFILNHEKDSKNRGLTLSSRGVFLPELNIYNLHLKKDQACNNLSTLEKYYFQDNNFQNIDKSEEYEKIYGFNYDFTNSKTQLYYYSLLKQVYPIFSERFYQLIIDIYYDKKISIFERYNKLDNIASNVNIFLLSEEFKETNKKIFETINYDKFIQVVNYQYIYDTEKWIAKDLIENAKSNYILDENINPDNIIKQFCKNKFNINEINEPYTILSDKLIIMGDLNIILCENCIDNKIVRIKKSSYSSSQDENEPFNILLNMNLSANGNDAILSFIS